MKKIAILGATGSIGRQALDIIEKNPDLFTVTALTAHRDSEQLISLAKKFGAKYVGLTGVSGDIELEKKVPKGVDVGFGIRALVESCAAGNPDIVLIAVVGIAGLPPLVECLEHGTNVALANKESLVCGGHIVKEKQKTSKSELFPVDSELCAVYQCLKGVDTTGLRRVILTASGGPFFDWSKEDIANATVEQALRHPNWNMGKKITVDCATYMNKGLEIIETKWLFDISPEMIDVVVHRQSIIHSMIEYNDGAVIAQMGPTDMRQPIQYAFGHPERLESAVGHLDFASLKSLTFDKPDLNKFPCLRHAMDAISEGGAMPVILNAANEAAVELFLERKIPFGGIEQAVASAMSKFAHLKAGTLLEIYNTDTEVKRFVYNNLK
ncbi:MAG: 1-deoxy-D-xylulose-5-phosphate reductoisomerase [Clostridia bacterium]|jgi:1-deoxy-D-xylulose-5-phosphate reductoisomerase|nr:1-deoxy-D-xylulose-5-phosphate reductoisomerase [Clostridia bacterium]MBT7122265.1 1-deoxy-D-xylulose-5-phosphate reductoisomerase [Clostridia bacterium]